MNFVFAYNIFLCVFIGLGAIVMVSLFFVKAGYGILSNNRWGKTISNKVGWCLMEMPVFICMWILYALSDRVHQIPLVVFLVLFELHYFQRTLIFPFLMKGKSKIPLSIVSMGFFFNLCNAFMQGYYLFYLSPPDKYPNVYLLSPQFIIGVIVFFTGMIINWHSDSVIRSLRKPGDTKHYFPDRGMYKYVTSANYFGEIVEWLGFALLTWSIPGLVFAWWTIANLLPRAAAINTYYKEKFPEDMARTKKKRIIPFIY